MEEGPALEEGYVFEQYLTGPTVGWNEIRNKTAIDFYAVKVNCEQLNANLVRIALKSHEETDLFFITAMEDLVKQARSFRPSFGLKQAAPRISHRMITTAFSRTTNSALEGPNTK